ncbi:hypothetical protein [Streptomyces sp. NPDC096033]|uniref:hypothetical protein n=1 Tax=Streptomyces sp. NPDC096033 TaxID=3366071 RepID=UPI00381788A7
MNRTETDTLLAYVAAFDNRNVTEMMTTAWADALEDIPLDADCKKAVASYYSTPPADGGELWPMKVIDVVTGRKKIRAARLENVPYSPPPGAEDESGLEYTRRLRRQNKAIADGSIPVPAMRPALESTPHLSLAATITGIGRTIPDRNDAPSAGRTEVRSQQKHGGAMTVVCPEPTCGARIGQPCRMARKNKPRPAPHGARVAYAATGHAPTEADRTAAAIEQQRRRDASAAYLAQQARESA